MLARENRRTARPTTPARTTMMALNRSATRVMPKGAGQAPAWVVRMPSRQTEVSSARPAPRQQRDGGGRQRDQQGQHQQHVVHQSLTFRSSGSSLAKV